VNWSDGGPITHNVVTPATAVIYTARFSTQVSLFTSVIPVGSGGVSPVGSSSYSFGSVVPVIATPSPAYRFTGWSGPVAAPSSASTTVTMNGSITVTANFTGAPWLTTTSGAYRGRQITKRGNTTITTQGYYLWLGTCNNGLVTAQNVHATSIMLNTTTVSDNFPTFTLGPLQCGTTQRFFPLSVGSPGTFVPLRFSISYTGGSPVLTSTRIFLPN